MERQNKKVRKKKKTVKGLKLCHAWHETTDRTKKWVD